MKICCMREISTDKQYRKIYLHQKKESINEIKHALVEQDVIRLLCCSTIWPFNGTICCRFLTTLLKSLITLLFYIKLLNGQLITTFTYSPYSFN